MDKKYQIFVSSTFTDLVEERQDAIRTILDLEHIPAGMELFPASDTEQFEYITRVIDECDYYVLIMGGRYGSLDAEGISFTEREYDYAVDQGKVVLAFIHGDPASITLGKSDIAPRLIRSLDRFRSKVSKGRLVKHWTTRENLEPLVVKAITRAIHDSPGEGWVRGNSAGSAELLQQINELRIQNNRLKEANRKLQSAIKPKLPDFSGIDQPFDIRFETMNGSQASSIALSWSEILLAVGPEFMKPTHPQRVADILESYIFTYQSLDDIVKANEEDIDMIVTQLIAFDFLRHYDIRAVNEGATELLELTPSGRSKLAELLSDGS